MRIQTVGKVTGYSMTLGYLMNTYPITSTTFIRREIRAHETAGHPVTRFAIRPWDGTLVDPADHQEQSQTTYLLARGIKGLVAPFLREAIRNPIRLVRAIGTATRLAMMAQTKRLYNFAYLLESVHLKQMATTQGITHLHAHFSTNAAAVAMLSHLLGGPTYSFTVHGPDELPDLATSGIALKLRHAQFVAAITQYCRTTILDAAGAADAAKVHVVHCGLDLADFPAKTGTDPAQSNEIVCVGRLCWQKAQTTLVAALAQIKDTHPDLRLTLIGDGDTRPQIEALIDENGLHDRITLAGWGTNAQVRDALSHARAMVLPSLAEGLPIVIMEAMALNRPVISTRIAGIPELLDATCGWIIAPDDVQPLTDALADCAAAPADRLRAMGAEGRARVTARHDQTQTAAELRALIGQGG